MIDDMLVETYSLFVRSQSSRVSMCVCCGDLVFGALSEYCMVIRV